MLSFPLSSIWKIRYWLVFLRRVVHQYATNIVVMDTKIPRAIFILRLPLGIYKIDKAHKLFWKEPLPTCYIHLFLLSRQSEDSTLHISPSSFSWSSYIFLFPRFLSVDSLTYIARQVSVPPLLDTMYRQSHLYTYTCSLCSSILY